MPRHAGNDGFSLVESLIACVILATALLSIGHLSSAAVALVADARARTLATNLAVAKLEELRTSLNPVAGGDVVDDAGQPASTETRQRFDRRWSVTSISADVEILGVVVVPSQRGPAWEIRITSARTVAR